MAETSFEVQLKALKARIVPMERLVAAIAGSVPKPLFYHSGKEHFGFRYAKPGVLHFCLLKAVRTVSALNAMVALARGGYAQEIGVLLRTLVECTTHIEFVLDALDGEGVLRSEVDKYVRDYLGDYARNSSADFRRAQVRQGLVHKHLGETLDIAAKQDGSFEGGEPAETVYSSVYLMYSNYVHAKYPEVMDLYGGDPGRFHLDGMRGTPKDDENFAAIDTFIDTAAIALKLIVDKLRLHHLLESDTTLRIWFRSS
jgi:hypothetical protein